MVCLQCCDVDHAVGFSSVLFTYYKPIRIGFKENQTKILRNKIGKKFLSEFNLLIIINCL